MISLKTQTRVPMIKAGRDGVVRLERVRVICPACRQPVEAVAGDGRVKGYCAVARQNVDFLIETPGPDARHRARIGVAMKKRWQDPEYRARMAAIRQKPDPGYRARIGVGMKRRWQDPGYRAKIVAIRQKRWQDPEYRAKMAAIREKRGS